MIEPLYAATHGHVICIEPRSGADIWRTRLGPGSTFVSLMVARDHIFAGLHGQCYALDRNGGGIIWHNNLPRTGYHTVLLHDTAGGQSGGPPCPNCHRVVAAGAAFCSHCGAPIEGESPGGTPPPLMVTLNGRILALDRRTGDELWRWNTPGSGCGSPVSLVFCEDRIFAGCYGHVHALHAATGEKLWTNDLPKLFYGIVSLAMYGAAGTSASDLSLAASHIAAQQTAAASAAS